MRVEHMAVKNTGGAPFQDRIVRGENFVAVMDGVWGFEDPTELMERVEVELLQGVEASPAGMWTLAKRLTNVAKDAEGACTLALVAWAPLWRGYAFHGLYIGDAGIAHLRNGKILGITFDPVENARAKRWGYHRNCAHDPAGFGVLFRRTRPEFFHTLAFHAEAGDDVVLFTDGGREIVLGESIPEKHGDITLVWIRVGPETRRPARSSSLLLSSLAPLLPYKARHPGALDNGK